MKKWVKPYITLQIFDTRDMLTASGNVEDIGNDGNAFFGTYDYNETWL